MKQINSNSLKRLVFLCSWTWLSGRFQRGQWFYHFNQVRLARITARMQKAQRHGSKLLQVLRRWESCEFSKLHLPFVGIWTLFGHYLDHGGKSLSVNYCEASAFQLFSWAPGSQVVASWVPHSKSPSETVEALSVMSQVCFFIESLQIALFVCLSQAAEFARPFFRWGHEHGKLRRGLCVERCKGMQFLSFRWLKRPKIWKQKIWVGCLDSPEWTQLMFKPWFLFTFKAQ